MKRISILVLILFTWVVSVQWMQAGSKPKSTVFDAPGAGTAVGKSSTENSASGLSSLLPDAQGPISAALGKDDSAYWVHPNAKDFREENSRHALVAEFTREGAEVHSHNLRWGLETRGYGYGDALHRVKAVAPWAKANRVEYRRDGVTEWYENGPLGLEQGFMLAHPPGKANGQPLTVELALRGDLVASPEPGGRALELRGKDGKAALRYTGLKARDATGRELRSWLEVRGERLLVRVDDGGARYPVVVDPWIKQAELTASDGAGNDEFGWSVALSGSTAVVGARRHPGGTSGSGPGAAYVFVESGGTWSQQAELTAPDGAELDDFGYSVAVDGSTVVVGAPWHTGGSNKCQGAAYVFVESGGTWSQQAELTASDGAANDQFGLTVALSGSTAMVGTLNHTPGGAYVFVQRGGTWTQHAELTASDGAANDGFGFTVALSGSTAVVGAPGHNAQGAAYVFVQSGGTWTQQAELTASDGAANDGFGSSSVAVSGSTAVVGASSKTVGSNQYQGAAYVFVESGGTWSQQAELTASDGTKWDFFGNSVTVSGSTAVVGVSYHWVGSNQHGAAYVFVESGGTWSQQAELLAPGGTVSEYFGQSVVVSGSTMVVGEPGHTFGSNFAQGVAYVFGSSGPLYTLSADPNSLSVPEGGQRTSTITITPYNGFSGSVSLSASGLPYGVTAAFDPNPATNTSTLTLRARGTATTGTTTVILAGVSGSLAQTTTLTLTVMPSPAVTLSPTSLSFGNQALDKTSGANTVVLKNTGTLTLNISSITVSGDFAISANTCTATLAAGKKCKVQVTFTPTQLGARTGTLTFTDNAPDSPHTVPLSGTGVPQATLTPANATYAKQKVGRTSATKTFTLTNHQTVTLTSIAISTTGDFAVSATTCGTSLAANSKCKISVTFTPTQTGTRTGQLSVSDSANDSPQTSNLKGTGI
jgi:nucleoside-specific outer membrane channel protein Tsx